jgi:hypothetical protein
VFGTKSVRNDMINKLKTTPLTLCGANVIQEEQAKYLGDQLCGLGLADSVAATVGKRRGMVTRTIFEVRTVIDDFRCQVAGGLTAGLDIWEMAVLPMLLNNADCWMNITNKTVEELDKLQLMFLRCLLAVGSGCPTPLLLSETGSVKMEFRILERKLLFLHHVATLPNSALAKEIYNVQTQLNLPGLAQECHDFLVKFGIIQIENYSKEQWKTLVKKKIREMNKNNILQQIVQEGYKKVDIEQMKEDSFNLKQYMKDLNVYDARMKFKLNSFMTPTIKMNFQSDSEFARELWTCPGCSKPGDVTGCRDTQRHIMVCSGYETLREDKDLSTDKGLVAYFQQVIKQRQNNNEE